MVSNVSISMFEIELSSSLANEKNFPQSIMAFVGISSWGPSKVIFVEPKVKISADYYVNKVLKPFFKDVSKNLFPDNDFIFHQDSAPSHAVKMTLGFGMNYDKNWII